MKHINPFPLVELVRLKNSLLFLMQGITLVALIWILQQSQGSALIFLIQLTRHEEIHLLSLFKFCNGYERIPALPSSKFYDGYQGISWLSSWECCGAREYSWHPYPKRATGTGEYPCCSHSNYVRGVREIIVVHIRMPQRKEIPLAPLSEFCDKQEETPLLPLSKICNGRKGPLLLPSSECYHVREYL